MRRTFKSKIDLLLLLPVFIVVLAAEILMIINASVIGMIAFGVIAAFIAYLCFNTMYMLTKDHKLRIKSGFLYNREIYIKSIKKVRPTGDRSASPALSFDRLEISYDRYGRVVVSPENKTDFIKELKEVNPRIRVEEGSPDSLYHSVEERIGELLSFKRSK